MSRGPRVIVALDYANADAALAFAKQVTPDLCRLKVGKELFTAAGPQLVEMLQNRGFDIFLDLKFHDIPNTVAAACKAAAGLGVWLLNVHALGGPAMLAAAANALHQLPQRPLLIGVTVLTSMDQQQLQALGVTETPEALVKRLAGLTRDAGLDGVVCSAQEAPVLRQLCGEKFLLVTPGIRPLGSAHHDQKRIMTPQAAMAAGADYLVIGRPITESSNPCQTLLTINEELSDRHS